MSLEQRDKNPKTVRKNAYARASCVCAKIQHNLKELSEAIMTTRGGVRGKQNAIPLMRSKKNKRYQNGIYIMRTKYGTKTKQGAL